MRPSHIMRVAQAVAALAIIVLAAAGAGLAAGQGVGTTIYLPFVGKQQAQPPSVAVSLAVTPSIVDLIQGPSLFVQVTAANTGQGMAPPPVVTVMYDQDLVELTSWPAGTTSVGGGSITLTLPGPVAPGGSVTAQLGFDAYPSDTSGVLLQFAGNYNLPGTGVGGQTNTVSARALGPLPQPPGLFSCAPTEPYPPLGVQPATGRAPVGSRFLFAAFADICGYTFAPGETVSLWVNTPGGVIQPLDHVIADDQGDIERWLGSAGYTPGCYSTVASSQDQDYQLVGAFILDNPDGSPACGGASASPPTPRADSLRLRPGVATPQLLNPAGAGGVAGRVTGSGGAPLGAVLVVARRPGGPLLASTLTAAGGDYRIPAGLPAGSLEVTFYASRSANPATAAYADASKILLGDGATMGRLDAALVLGAQVAGRVAAQESGTGLPGVAVLVVDAAGRVHAAASTNADGTYVTPALPDGDYTLRFRPGDGSGYVGGDRAIAVRGAQRVTGADMLLARCPTCGGISGHIFGAGGVGIPDVTVAVQDSASGRLIALARTDTRGAYSATVGSGSYRIAALPDYAALAESRRYLDGTSAGSIAVRAPQVTTEVGLTLSPGAQIVGRVTAGDSGAPLAGVRVTVKDEGGALVATAVTDAAGAYQTPGLALGAYQLSFRPAPGSTLTYGETIRTLVVAGLSIIEFGDIALPWVAGQ